MYARYLRCDDNADVSAAPSAAAPAASSDVAGKVKAAAAAPAAHQPSANGKPAFLLLFKEDLLKEGASEIRDFLPSTPGGLPMLHTSCSLYKALGQKKLSLCEVMSWSLVSRFRDFAATLGGSRKGEGTVNGSHSRHGQPAAGRALQSSRGVRIGRPAPALKLISTQDHLQSERLHVPFR